MAGTHASAQARLRAGIAEGRFAVMAHRFVKRRVKPQRHKHENACHFQRMPEGFHANGGHYAKLLRERQLRALYGRR